MEHSAYGRTPHYPAHLSPFSGNPEERGELITGTLSTQQPPITISIKRTRWLGVSTTAFVALLAALLVLDWRVEPGQHLIWFLQLLLLVVISYRTATLGFEIEIRDEKVRIRSLLRSFEFSVLATDGVSPYRGTRRRMWVVHYVKEGQRRNIVVISKLNLSMTVMAKAPPLR